MDSAYLLECASLLLRSLGFAATLVASCALASLHFQPGIFRNTAGGILGEAAGGAIEHTLGLLGGTLALLAVWFTAVSGPPSGRSPDQPS